MTPERSKYEVMRVDPANWKLGIIYYCPDDPRVVVRQRLPLGWTWNFGHSLVVPAIALAILIFLAPPVVAWWLGVRSGFALALIVATALGAIMIAANWLSQIPKS